jgi:hypothetical protein
MMEKNRITAKPSPRRVPILIVANIFMRMSPYFQNESIVQPIRSAHVCGRRRAAKIGQDRHGHRPVDNADCEQMIGVERAHY